MRASRVVVFLLSTSVIPLHAQQSDSAPPPLATAVTFRPGTLVPRVASSLNRVQQYAVYLPSAYRADRQWPVLLLLDPRGRALLPMRLFQASAERYGFVVLSSWNTLSDWDNQPNVDAMSAMLTDVQRLFSVDRSRIYLAGFSGTARFAWDVALGLRANVAGILGFGAGVPPGFNFTPPGAGTPLAVDFFGGAGTSDFNYEELLSLDEELARLGVAHRVRMYDGPHSWAPEPVVAEGVQWMQLRAMGRGLAAVDTGWVDSLFAARVELAGTRLAGGDSLGALREYRAIAADFTGMHEVAVPATRADTLARSRAVKAALKDQAEMIARNHDYLRKLLAYLQRFRTANKPPSVESGLKALDIARLKRVEEDRSDTVAALAAGRLLSHVRAATGFYEPQDYLAKGDSARALAMLELNQAVNPNPGRPASVAFRELVDEFKRRTP